MKPDQKKTSDSERQLQQELAALRAELEETKKTLAVLQAGSGGAPVISPPEAQFRALADAITNLAWWANADGYITWYNRRWYEYTGTTPEQMEGWGWQSVHDPQALPAVMERWQASIATGEPFDMTFPLRGADGQFRRFLTRIVPVKDAQGRVLRWFGTNTDVEELKRAEEAVRASEARFRAVFETMTEGFSLNEIVLDGAGKPCDLRYLAVNAAFERHTGLKAADIVGHTLLELFPDAETEWVERYGKVALTGEPAHFEGAFGALGRWFDVSAFATGAGQFAVIFTDLTARKQREEELHKLNRTLRAMSSSNQATMRATAEAAYMQAVCANIVKDCGHVMAWVGYARQDEGRTVEAVAYAGREAGYLQGAQITWADTERGRGPTGSAIRTGQVSICNNMLTDPRFGPWREQAATRGFASSIALPLRDGGAPFGALTIYSEHAAPFSQEEVGLLTELADDLAYGIAALRLRASHAQATEALRQSEAMLQRAQGIANLGSWALDVPSGRFEWSDEVYRIFGVTPGAFTPNHDSFLAAIHPEDRARVTAAIARALARQESYQLEYRIVRPEGTVRDVVAQADVDFDAAGKPARVVGAVLDITQRKQAENTLRFLVGCGAGPGADFFQELAHYLGESLGMDFVCIDTLEQGLLAARTLAMYFDGKFEDNVSYTLQDTPCGDVVGKGVCCFPAGVRHRFPKDAVLQDMLAESYVGTTLWSAQGKPIGLIAVIGRKPLADTKLAPAILQLVGVRAAGELERRQAEEALRQSHERMQRVLEVETVGVMFWDLNTGCLVDANDTFLKMMGYTRRDVEAHDLTWQKFTPPEYYDVSRAEVAKFMVTGRVGPYEKEYFRKDGTRQWLLFAGSSLGNNQCVEFCVDISDRKKAEEELKAAKLSAEQAQVAAEAANQSKDHFIAVLSHELRNPLNPVLTAATLLRQNSHLDPDTHEQLEIIYRNAELEARLIDDLLDVTRIERGKVELDRQPIELCTIISRAAEVCIADIKARRIEFGVDLGPDAPYFVNADAARLQQVFWNLLKNAIKFTPPGGCVGIRCRQLDGQVLAEVNDSGVGIAPHILPHIFDAFEQGSRETTRQFGGLGLGLAISKALVDLHDGTLTAHSAGYGQGATFTLRLPLVAAPSRSPAASPAATSAAAQPLRILLVEDHADTARIMRRLLAAHGHTVEFAADLASATRLATTQPFDLLLSDLGLPDGSGLDLIRALRARGLTLPAIALSGYGQDQDVQQCRDAGFTTHLTKPINVAKLQHTIAALVPSP